MCTQKIHTQRCRRCRKHLILEACDFALCAEAKVGKLHYPLMAQRLMPGNCAQGRVITNIPLAEEGVCPACANPKKKEARSDRQSYLEFFF